jgi:SulP family sulfate permease
LRSGSAISTADLWLDLLPTSTMIALVSYVESYSIGTTLATRQRTRVNSHQELIALGAANVSAAFTGAYPVAGSFTRSSVNYQSGARTQVSSLVCMVVIVFTLLLFTPLFSLLPHTALAAIVIISVLGLIDLKSIRSHWQVHREDSITQLVTLITVLLFGVETGLITGVALSVAFFVRRVSRPHVAIVGRVGNSEHFRAARRFDVQTFAHVAAIRIDESLFFANANQIESKLLKIIQRRPGTRHVVLVCSAVNMIDVSGLEMLYRINENLERMGIELHLSEVKSPVMEQLDATDFLATLHGNIFFTTDQAMRELGEQE